MTGSDQHVISVDYLRKLGITPRQSRAAVLIHVNRLTQRQAARQMRRNGRPIKQPAVSRLYARFIDRIEAAGYSIQRPQPISIELLGDRDRIY